MNAPLVLVVDDTEDNRYLYRAGLEFAGYSVVEASSAVEAIDVAQAGSPALVLMDLYLPGGGGIEAVAALRTIPGFSSVPIIALTATAGVPDDVLHEAGFCGVLHFPVVPSEMNAVVTRCLEESLGASTWTAYRPLQMAELSRVGNWQ